MIYPLDMTIENILTEATDEETGEILLTEEELAEKIAAAKMGFEDTIKALRNSYLTDKLDAECIAAEASALYKMQQDVSKRAKAAENKAERKKRFIAWLLAGETFKKDGVNISYITRSAPVIEDGFVDWAKHNAPGLLNEPTIRRKDVEATLKAGSKLEFAQLEERKYIQVR